jgi:hypothetical protein
MFFGRELVKLTAAGPEPSCYALNVKMFMGQFHSFEPLAHALGFHIAADAPARQSKASLDGGEHGNNRLQIGLAEEQG